MKIAIIGFGVEGHLAYDYWVNDENQITICDENEDIEVPTGANSKLGASYLSNLNEFDLIIRSAGVSPAVITKANNKDILDIVTTTTNEFFRVSPTKNIIGVTGTKGKGTTSTLLTKLLIASGLKTYLGGNVGNGAMDVLKNDIKPDDWVVLELSSFQLIDLKYSPHIAVCLMIAPEHLNWHLDFAEYVDAKSHIFTSQVESDIAVYYSKNEYSSEIANLSHGHKIPYFEEPGAYVKDGQIRIDGQVICRIEEIKLLGEHNWQNVCAALTAYWQVSQNKEVARSVITQFDGLEHRLELVKKLDGISYYNDSFASAPDASVAAMAAIKGYKVMLIGGFDRGLELTGLAKAVKQHESDIRRVILIGASAERIAKALREVDFNNFEVSEYKNITEIIGQARGIAQTGDAIVLSPGFASFDMFKNFEDRGRQFKDTVNSL